MQTLLEQYHLAVMKGEIQENPSQIKVVNYLDELNQTLQKKLNNQKPKWQKLLPQFTSSSAIRGLYLWGNVGVGKSYLVNLFFSNFPAMKARYHFHDFMQNIQEQLKKLQGTKNPLQKIANTIAEKTLVLVLDEFLVTDIVDAMILSELLNTLFQKGITLITTSNTAPDLLYADGIQRERFLPAIACIKKYTEVVHLDITTDYRLKKKSALQAYYYPLNDETEKALEYCFQQFSKTTTSSEKSIQLLDRNINIQQLSTNIIWFDFLAICGRPRAVQDYLLLVQRYHTIIISDVPVLTAIPIDQVVSFIYLIDILYDQHIRTIISAAVPIRELYPEGKFRKRFERTESRLMEMQSTEYFILNLK